MNISTHFTLLEFTYSETGEAAGIKNIPNLLQIRAMESLCDNILEPIRAHFDKPVTIRSGFRTKALNALLKGSPTSQHMAGEAADFEISGVRNDVIWEWIVDTLNFDQVIAEKLDLDDGSAGWIHVSHKKYGKQRKEALSFLGDGKYIPGLVYINRLKYI